MDFTLVRYSTLYTMLCATTIPQYFYFFLPFRSSRQNLSFAATTTELCLLCRAVFHNDAYF